MRMVKSQYTVPGFKPPSMIGVNKSVAGYSITGMKARRPEWYREDLARLLSLLAGDRLRPMVAEKFTLDSVALAHEMMGERSFAGKLVLLTSDN